MSKYIVYLQDVPPERKDFVRKALTGQSWLCDHPLGKPDELHFDWIEPFELLIEIVGDRSLIHPE